MRQFAVFSVIFLFALACLLSGAELLFSTVHCSEGGDFAVLGLQVRLAERFELLVGPYSRFRFNHPGPVSAYFFAVFDNALGFIPAPFLRYQTAQFLLNLFFVGLAFYIPLRVTDRPHTLVPFLGLFLVFLLLLKSEILWSIWGPAVAVCPMFCLLLASAAVSTGIFTALPIAVFAGIFVTHNHLGTVVVVSAVVALALVIALFRHRSNFNWRWASLAVLIFLVGYVPVFLDWWFYSAESNPSRVFKFLTSREAKKSWAQSVSYISSFWGHPLILILGLVLPLTSPDFKKRGYFFSLYVLTLVSLVLGVLAATRIVGRMYDYLMLYQNVNVVVLCALSFTAITQRLTFLKSAYINITAILLLGYLALARTPLPTTIACNSNVDALVEQIQPKDGTVYMMSMRGPKRNHAFNDTVATALALERRGYQICVNKRWAYMFDRARRCDGIEYQNRTIEELVFRYNSESQKVEIERGG